MPFLLPMESITNQVPSKHNRVLPNFVWQNPIFNETLF